MQVLKLCTSSKNTKKTSKLQKIANIKKHKHNIKFLNLNKAYLFYLPLINRYT